MQNTLTLDGIIFLSTILVVVLSTFLWILIKARLNNGIAEIPSILMFGWGGAAWSPNIIVISKDAWNKDALIAHERHHQKQQLRDGLFTFYFKYIFNKKYRAECEIEAYKVWLQVRPNDLEYVANIMVNSYGLNLSIDKVKQLLKEPLVNID